MTVQTSLMPVTDEFVIRPPRRADDRLYICKASILGPDERHGGPLQIVLFTGESEKTETTLAGGLRVRLACWLDEAGERAVVMVMVTDPTGILTIHNSNVWLPR